MKLTDSQPVESMNNTDLGAWINAKIAQIQGISEFPSIEITAIASFVLEKPNSWILAHPETKLNESQLKALDAAFCRLVNGEPLSYITGRRSFYGLDFLVDERVLVPRPETELLVELAIAWLEENPDRTRVADIGTGSGVIAVTLAHHLTYLHVTAIDSSQDALDIAQTNASLHHVEDRVTFKQNNLLQGMTGKFDLIVANLPYIPTGSLDNLSELKYEPRTALDGGDDGLRIIEQLIETSKKNMTKKSSMILEIQYNQSEDVKHIVTKHYPQAIITIHYDLAGLPRVVTIQI